MKSITNNASTKLNKTGWLSVLYLSPTIIVVLFVTIIPLIYGLYLSLFDYHVGKKLTWDDFVGLANYAELLTDTVLHKAFINTVMFAVLANIGEIVLGTLISLALLKLNRNIGNFIRGLCTMSLLVSPIITGFIMASPKAFIFSADRMAR